MSKICTFYHYDTLFGTAAKQMRRSIVKYDLDLVNV